LLCPGKFQVVHDPLEQVREVVDGPALAPLPPAPMLKLVALMTRSSSSEPQFLQRMGTFSSPVPMTSTSMKVSHFRHLNSYIGISAPFIIGIIRTFLSIINNRGLSSRGQRHPAMPTECYALNPARVGQVAHATRQAVKSQ
jgi:hypothetical protein